MKLLFDECLSPRAVAKLRAEGIDTQTVADTIPGSSDQAVLALAVQESHVLVTLDKDLGELTVRSAQEHHGLIRLRHISAQDQAGVIAEVINRYREELSAKAIITVSPTRIRVRLADQPLRDLSEDA